MLRFIKYLCTILIAYSCNTPKTDSNVIQKHEATLVANYGFDDTISNSQANIYHSNYFIHDTTGYFNVAFYDSLFHHNYVTGKYDPVFPQVYITLNGVQKKNIALTLNFVQMNLCSEGNATFIVVFNNDGNKIDTVPPVSVNDPKTSSITFKSNYPSTTGIYYVSVYAIYSNPGCGFALNKIYYDYSSN